MKKGFSRWEAWRFNAASQAARKANDLLGHVHAKTEREALENAYAELSLRSEEDREGVYVKMLGY